VLFFVANYVHVLITICYCFFIRLNPSRSPNWREDSCVPCATLFYCTFYPCDQIIGVIHSIYYTRLGLFLMSSMLFPGFRSPMIKRTVGPDPDFFLIAVPDPRFL
jgi:hypothetical protein